MPKVVDHEQRREELAAAVWRVASRDGLEAVTLRNVAAEAGWSTGALHHYFSDKEELLLFAFRTVADRIARRVAAAREQATEPLQLARDLLELGLPLDADRRAEARVWFAFLGLAVTRPPLARAQRLAYRAWRRQVADALREAIERGDVDPGVDAEREAARVVALVDGLAVQASFEPRTLDVGLVDEHLDRLRTSPPASVGPVTVEPLRFDDGALLVLDQRALPGEERWIRCETPKEVADCIRTLAVRGAPAIGIAAAYGMALAGDDPAPAAELLRSARPTAVNLAWAVDQALASDDPLGCARRLHREQEEADRRLAGLGAERFEPGDRALTHCNTGPLATAGFGTAGGVLRAAWEQGRLERVWVDETRPLDQGARLTTWELERDGIPFRLVTDSSAGTLMARGLVDRIVVGADRIAANGDVANKVGTYPLAVLADRHGIPFYVAAPVSTIDPHTADGASIPIEERDPSELGSDAPALNLAFDVTPAELVTAIVTEAGVLEPPYEEAIAGLPR